MTRKSLKNVHTMPKKCEILFYFFNFPYVTSEHVCVWPPGFCTVPAGCSSLCPFAVAGQGSSVGGCAALFSLSPAGSSVSQPPHAAPAGLAAHAAVPCAPEQQKLTY